MMALFSDGGLRRLGEIVKPGMLCVFDFDGTLAPIVPQPERAQITLGVKRRLHILARLTPVAIITGRSLTDLTKRLEFEPEYVVGNHGLEGIPGWENRNDAYEALCRDWEVTIKTALADKTRFDPGIRVENKRYSLAVHYRFVRDPQKTEEQLVALFNSLTQPARVITGKCVFNLLPPDAAGKGAALEQLMKMSGAPAAIYVGDDTTDEDAFSLHYGNLATVRVGWKTGSAAKFYLSQRGEIVLLLDEIIRRLRSYEIEKPKPTQPSLVHSA